MCTSTCSQCRVGLLSCCICSTWCGPPELNRMYLLGFLGLLRLLFSWLDGLLGLLGRLRRGLVRCSALCLVYLKQEEHIQLLLSDPKNTLHTTHILLCSFLSMFIGLKLFYIIQTTSCLHPAFHIAWLPTFTERFLNRVL
jgi:hypothetical protein